MLVSLLAFLIISLILYRKSQQKHKANILLEDKNTKIQESLAALKATQSLLIQSEKMASLGELTAGIAHEIQNPLNFVNNFSEVNIELADELKSWASKRSLSDDEKNYLVTIVDDITRNQEKINHHGKRAESIVKSMLQHSSSVAGVRESTDINILVMNI